MNNNNNTHHHPITRNSSTTTLTESNEYQKKNSSPRRQTTRSTSNLTKDNLTPTNIQVIKPVAVRPPSTSYNLRSRTKLKTHQQTEVIPSFTEKLSLETPQMKPVPPLTRAAAASAGVKIDSLTCDESTKTSSNQQKTLFNSTQSTRSSTTRKRKASEDDHRPYLDLLKMKQVNHRCANRYDSRCCLVSLISSFVKLYRQRLFDLTSFLICQ